MHTPFSSRLAWPAAPNRLAALRARRVAEGLPVLDFSESNPTRVGLAAFEGSGALETLLDPAGIVYRPEPRGLARAREAVAGRLAARGSPGADPGRMFLCASTSEAYGWLFKLLCDPGDAVLVPCPGYPLFEYLAGLEAVEARPYRLEYFHPRGWRVDLDSVETALGAGRAKALVLINPNNPTGSYIGGDERAALVQLCARHGAALVSDEVFLDFEVEGAGRSMAGEEGALCFALDGLSKLIGLPQMKLGWICASGPARLLEEACGRLEIIADAYLSAASPVMNALPALLAAAPSFAAAMRARLRGNLATLRSALEGADSPHRVLRCEGGWTAVIESPRLLPEEELAESLLEEEGLWSHPGWFFDMEREAHFTAGLILPPEVFEDGVRRYRAFFERLQSGTAGR